MKIKMSGAMSVAKSHLQKARGDMEEERLTQKKKEAEDKQKELEEKKAKEKKLSELEDFYNLLKKNKSK